VRTVIKHVTQRIKSHWPSTHIIWRGDSHYGRVEAMQWAEDTAPVTSSSRGNAALDACVAEVADTVRLRHAMGSEASCAPG